MNVLLTCAGRRTYLVKAFREALQGRGEVFAADRCAVVPSLEEADTAFALPPFDVDGYVSTLIALCRELDVGLVISLNDLELRVLALEAQRFIDAGVTLVGSSPAVI